MSRGGEARHIRTDFGQYDSRRGHADAGNAGQQLDLAAKGGQEGLHPPLQFAHCLVERIDLTQVQLQEEAMVVADRPSQRLHQFLMSRLDPATPQAGQCIQIRLPGDQALDEGAPAYPKTSLINPVSLILASSRVF
jgi:hypothetical protein